MILPKYVILCDYGEKKSKHLCMNMEELQDSLSKKEKSKCQKSVFSMLSFVRTFGWGQNTYFVCCVYKRLLRKNHKKLIIVVSYGWSCKLGSGG